MIEKIIQENTAALKALAAAISSAGTATAESSDKPLRKPSRKKPAAKKEPTAGKAGITIKAISNLVLSVADTVNRETAVAILAEFGAKRIKQVPASKFALLAKRLKAALTEAQEELEPEAIDDDDLLGDEEDDLSDFDDNFDEDEL